MKLGGEDEGKKGTYKAQQLHAATRSEGKAENASRRAERRTTRYDTVLRVIPIQFGRKKIGCSPLDRRVQDHRNDSFPRRPATLTLLRQMRKRGRDLDVPIAHVF